VLYAMAGSIRHHFFALPSKNRYRRVFASYYQRFEAAQPM
jgi:hypothetical protein